MDWIWNALNSVQNAFGTAPTTSPELVLPQLKRLNDSVYELCKPATPRVERPSVEIVFFQGLQFDGSDIPFLTTWLTEDGQESWLPWIVEYFPEARILLISYDQESTDMYITSENLVKNLIDDRAQVGRDGCPIVLVGHSLGGLVIKEVLLSAYSTLNLDSSPDENLLFFLENLKHLFYYSCPHNGTRLVGINNKFLKGPLFEHLTLFNKGAARCNEQFRKLRDKFNWKADSVGENLPTDLGQLERHIVVEEASARFDTDHFYTAHADHVNVCRPKSTTDARFSNLKDVIDRSLGEDITGHKVSISYDIIVGVDDQIKRVRQKLEKSRQVGLFGSGGRGKTTLAKLVYNDMSSNFEYTSFVSEVKETLTKKASLNDLQAEILRNLYYKGRQVSLEWSRLQGKRVLIVLDDIEHESQILVLTESNGLSTESCVLLTSRDRRILRLKDFEIHCVELLDDEASKRLFCKHAFKIETAPEAYKDRVQRFTQKCGGWPLALEVVGKYLYKQKKPAVWDDAFNKFSEAKPLSGRMDADEFWPIFQVIYNSLATEEQQMFLDVAICFHEEELELVQETWRVCSLPAAAGWENLVDIGLVTTTISKSIYTKSTKIHMHEVLRDLGRSRPGHRRVWHDIDARPWPFEQGNSELKILKIVSSGGQPYPRHDQRCTLDIAKLCGLENLKALWLDGVTLHGAYNLFPPNLEFLKVKGCEWSDKSTSFLLGGLVRLRALTIDGCLQEAISESLGLLLALESLTISNCQEVKALPSTIGQLSALKSLTISNCPVTALPSTIDQLSALESLTISECYRIEALPPTLGRLGGLKLLRISQCGLRRLPDELGNLGALTHLEITGCRYLDSLPHTLKEHRALRHLEIDGHHTMQSLQNILATLQPLQHLSFLNARQPEQVLERLGQLDSVKHLHVWNGMHPYHRVGEEELRSREFFEILPALPSERFRIGRMGPVFKQDPVLLNFLNRTAIFSMPTSSLPTSHLWRMQAEKFIRERKQREVTEEAMLVARVHDAYNRSG
ncbi:unnamed protein product [Calypogeia fissa]